MNRSRHFLLVLFIATIAPTACPQNCNAAEQKRPPNIVFFLVDDMGWNDTQPYGSKFHETPNVTRLAKQGMRFTNAYAACPVCSPTRASIMTGKYPATLNLTDFIPGHYRPYAKMLVPKMNMQLPLNEVSLAECVKPAGYVSGSFGKWHLGGPTHNPDKQGFDDYVVTGGRHFAPNFRTTPKVDVKKGEYLGDFLTRQAEQFIETNRDKPFLLYLPHYAVHIPLEAKQALVEKYRKKGGSPVIYLKISSTEGIGGDTPKQILGLLKANGQVASVGTTTSTSPEGALLEATWNVRFSSDTDIHEVLKAVKTYIADKLPKTVKVDDLRVTAVNNPTYAAMVEHIDQSLGRIMQKLDDLKLADNTVLVFFSDNGGLYRRFDAQGPAVMSNHPLRDEKGSLYEGGIREPCIIRWPGVVKPGSTCDVPITSVDFWPTIAEIAGTTDKHKHKVDGISLLPLLKQTDRLKVDRALYWHYPHYHHTHPAGAIRYGDYKLIEYFEDGKLELYNLKTDLGETTDLAKKHPKQVKELHAMLKQWRKDIGAKMPTKNPNYDPKRQGEWHRRPRPKPNRPKNKPRAKAAGSTQR